MKITTVLSVVCLFLASFAGAIPLPEHPRPDWERAEWLNLNGEWDFGFAENKLDQKIVVPFGWGSKLSGVADKGDTGWYGRTVKVPEAWKGKRVFLVIGASDHDTTCWFDKSNLGTHSGGYTPFEFELTDHVAWGKDQTVRFKVWDVPASLAAHDWRLYGKQGYGNARGIWQTVYLEARGEEYLRSVKFYPDVAASRLTAKVRLGAPAAKPLAAKLAFEKVDLTVPFAPGEMEKSVEIPMPDPHLWTLDDPYLYTVTVTLSPTIKQTINQTIQQFPDSVRTYFGFRQVGVGKNPNGDSYVTLNGKPIYLQLTLDQSYHPDGWYTFPTDEFMKNEILISKQLGLSGNRVHIKVEVPRKLYWADKLGLLIMADVPCAWGPAAEAMFREHRFCFEDMVERDFNHPCIFSWVLFNETWGLFADGEACDTSRAQRYAPWVRRAVADVWAYAKQLDPTRLVEDNSPCNRDHVVTDINTWHAYRPGYCWEAEVKGWCDGTAPGRTDNYIGGHVQTGAPMFNSECGNVWGYSGSTGDCDFSWDYHLMMNAFRRHLKCGGWLYTEHHDVINEWNGYVRFDRSPKYDGMDELADMTLADLHRDAALFFAGKAGSEIGEMLAPGQKVTIPVGVSFTTDRYSGRALALKVESWHFDGEGRRIKTAAYAMGSSSVSKSWQCEKLWDVGFAAPDEPSCGCVCLTLTADGMPIAKNFWSYGVATAAPKAIAAAKADWSLGSTNVLGGLKLNGFGKGFFEFNLPVSNDSRIQQSNNPTIKQSNNSYLFRAELSSRPLNGKDSTAKDKGVVDLNCMLGGGFADRSKNPNSYPMTSSEKHPSNLKIYANGQLVKSLVLENDPCDHRGILSWLSQPHDNKLREAGTYGQLVEAEIPASAVKDGKVTVRLEADNGLAVYGPVFGRYPFGPHIGAK